MNGNAPEYKNYSLVNFVPNCTMYLHIVYLVSIQKYFYRKSCLCCPKMKLTARARQWIQNWASMIRKPYSSSFVPSTHGEKTEVQSKYWNIFIYLINLSLMTKGDDESLGEVSGGVEKFDAAVEKNKHDHEENHLHDHWAEAEHQHQHSVRRFFMFAWWELFSATWHNLVFKAHFCENFKNITANSIQNSYNVACFAIQCQAWCKIFVTHFF